MPLHLRRGDIENIKKIMKIEINRDTLGSKPIPKNKAYQRGSIKKGMFFFDPKGVMKAAAKNAEDVMLTMVEEGDEFDAITVVIYLKK